MRWLKLVFFLPILFLNACTTLKPQTGELSFRLLWDGKADLDLHVIDPGGGHVGLPFLAAAAKDPERFARVQAELVAGKNPDGETAGLLDIDCNADIERLCRKPMENIFWPPGTAPRGEYQVWVEFFQQTQSSEEVPFILELRRGEKVVQRLVDKVSSENRKSQLVRYTY